MAKEVGDAVVGKNSKDAQSESRLNCSQYLLEDANGAVDAKASRDRDAVAPASAERRVWEVTKLGVQEIPNGFVNSFDSSHILPNIGIGLAIGAGSKLLLAEGGPVAKVAGGLMTAYFVGTPLVNGYGKAVFAKNMGDIYDGASILGDAVGGLPVAMAEGAIGAKLGSAAVGSLLSTRTAAPFVEWKANQYSKLDAYLDGTSANARNFAFERFGIGGPQMRSGVVQGVVPPYLLEELAMRNPQNPAYMETIKKTGAIRMNGRLGEPVATVDHAGAREVYDAAGQEVVGKKVRSEGQPKTGDVEADNVYDFTGDVRNLYKDVYNRNSIDNRGMKLESTVNYGENFENAFWDGERMTYGKPGAESPFRTFVLRDVTGHEMTHGVTQFESNLVYRGQSGALNESISDVFGALVEQRAANQTAKQASWLVGDGIWKPGVKGRALRDMMNPGTAYDDVAIGKDPQPAHMKDFIKTRSDNGGVHLNSGIPNRAFALFAQDVGGFAWESPGKIWYQARANAGSTPSFAQFAHHTVEAARTLGYTAELPKLQKAWLDVGITPSLTETGLPKSALSFLMTNTNPDRKVASGW